MLRQCSLTSRFWTTITTRSLSTDWQSRLEALQSATSRDYEGLLSQYATLIREQPHNQGHNAVDSMYETYQKWRSSHHDTPTTFLPFQTMLEVFCERRQSAYSMKVLQDWHMLCSGHIDLQPPVTTYDAVIQTFSQDDNRPDEAFEMGSELLAFLEQCYFSKMSELPNARTYQNIISILDNTSSSSLDEAQLQRLTDKFFQTAPTKQLIWKVLQVVSKHLHRVDEPHAREYYDHFLRLLDWVNDTSDLETTAQAFLSYLPPSAGSELLVRLTELQRPEIPSGRHYTTMIERWDGNTSEQEFVLQLMLQTQSCKDTTSLNALLRAHLLAGLPDQVIRLWKDNFRQEAFAPLDTESFTVILQALAASRETDSAMERKIRAQQAHRLLRKTMQREDRYRQYQLTPAHFASVMIAWSKSPDPKAAEYCEQVYNALLELNMEANHHHITALIISWGNSKSPDATIRVQQLFESFDYAPDPKVHAAVLYAFSKTSPKEAKALYDRCEDFSLNTACFNSVALSNTEMTEEIFERHWNAYERSGFSSQFRPNSWSYIAYARGKENPIIVLDHCERQAENGCVDPPDAPLFTEVMRVYAERGHAEIAYKVFQRMSDSYRSGNLTAKPDAHAVTTLLRAFAWSKLPNKVELCQMILDQMITDFEDGDVSMKPTSFTYGAVLSACSTSSEPIVTDVAFGVFERVEEPNEHIFRYLLLVIVRHIHDPRHKAHLAQSVLQRCCSAGFLDKAIIGMIESKISHLFETTMLESLRRRAIPKSWSRNVKTRSCP